MRVSRLSDGSSKRPLAVAMLLLVCLTVVPSPVAAQERGWSAETTGTVTADGELTAVTTTIEIDERSYQELREQARQAGFESAAALVASSLASENPTYGGFGDTEVRPVDGRYQLYMEFTNVDVDRSERTELSVEDGRVALRIGDVTDPATSDTIAETVYRIEMPGEITSTNAYETDGNVAVWRLHEDAPNVLSVESRLGAQTGASDATEDDDEGTSDEADDGDDGDDGDSSASGPGFGPVAGLIAVLAVALLTARHRT
ncbi:PGF-CTERM sorting domain-containing protein [Halorientalis pallida]|uniref:PGF-CTERM sorting domain-containing protein n=1 Tax=Halorientalis pallida TaxID=2479928 RepID=UPI003C6F3460